MDAKPPECEASPPFFAIAVSVNPSTCKKLLDVMVTLNLFLWTVSEISGVVVVGHGDGTRIYLG
jgi:hypothetical protein